MKTFGFSWKRVVGITATKRKISKAIGVPLTKSGRDAKIGRTVRKMFGFGK